MQVHFIQLIKLKNFLLELLCEIGFKEVHGPEIESEKFNFDMLNIGKFHPARQMHDTFYIENKAKVLRTHTSPVQIRSMLESKSRLLFAQLVKFIEKMMMLHIYQCFIK